MNSLIILPFECVDTTCAVLQNNRASYAFGTHGIRVGQTLRVAVMGGLRGTGLVTESSAERVVLTIELSKAAIRHRSVDLIVGVSRPQTVKKVIQAAVMLGVRSLHFVSSEQGEKSYLQSTALEPEGIEEETIKALEQVWDSRVPEICVHRSFEYFLKNRLSAIAPSEASLRIVAHPNGKELNLEQYHSSNTAAVVAIGPERGWSSREIELLEAQGFRLTGLGERVLRVEVALTFLLGQLELLLPTA